MQVLLPFMIHQTPPNAMPYISHTYYTRHPLHPLSFPVFLILHFSPIPLLRLIPTCLLRCALKRRLARIQLMAGCHAAFYLLAQGNRLISAKALAHIYHATLALSESLLELLAFGRHLIDEGWAKTVRGLVPINHHTVGFLEALRQRCPYVLVSWSLL